MAKFHGYIGFVTIEETEPEVYAEVAVEKEYSGDFKRLGTRYVQSANLNDNLVINNQIEVKTEPYILSHYPSIRYVRWRDSCWKVTSAEENFPRIILNLGEVYNGPTAQSE